MTRRLPLKPARQGYRIEHPTVLFENRIVFVRTVSTGGVDRMGPAIRLATRGLSTEGEDPHDEIFASTGPRATTRRSRRRSRETGGALDALAQMGRHDVVPGHGRLGTVEPCAGSGPTCTTCSLRSGPVSKPAGLPTSWRMKSTSPVISRSAGRMENASSISRDVPEARRRGRQPKISSGSVRVTEFAPRRI